MNLLKTRFYRHYKNKPYKFIGLVRHSETLEEMVLYETLYENVKGRLWVRPKAMFFEDVCVAGVSEPRFRPVEFTIKEFAQISNEIGAEIEVISRDSTIDKKLDIVRISTQLVGKKDVLCLLAYEQDIPVAFKLGYAAEAGKFISWWGGVSPAYCDLGLGTGLLRYQAEWCKQHGYARIETSVGSEDIELIKLVLANDFKIIGTTSEANSTFQELKVVFEKTLS